MAVSELPKIADWGSHCSAPAGRSDVSGNKRGRLRHLHTLVAIPEWGSSRVKRLCRSKLMPAGGTPQDPVPAMVYPAAQPAAMEADRPAQHEQHRDSWEERPALPCSRCSPSEHVAETSSQRSGQPAVSAACLGRHEAADKKQVLSRTKRR